MATVTFKKYINQLNVDQLLGLCKQNMVKVPGFRNNYINVPAFKARDALTKYYKNEKKHYVSELWSVERLEKCYLDDNNTFNDVILRDLCSKCNAVVIQEVLDKLGILADEDSGEKEGINDFQGNLSENPEMIKLKEMYQEDQENQEEVVPRNIEEIVSASNFIVKCGIEKPEYTKVLKALPFINLWVFAVHRNVERPRDMGIFDACTCLQKGITEYIHNIAPFSPPDRFDTKQYEKFLDSPEDLCFIVLRNLYYNHHKSSIVSMLEHQALGAKIINSIKQDWYPKLESIVLKQQNIIVSTESILKQSIKDDRNDTDYVDDVSVVIKESSNDFTKEPSQEELNQNNDLQLQIEKLAEEKNQLEAILDELKEEKQQLKERLDILENTSEKLSNELREEFDSISEELKICKAENEVLMESNNDLKRTVEELQKNGGVVNKVLTYENEEVFIDKLLSNAEALNLVYDKEDLLAFHVSTKASTLTILEGMSGTGKSQLVNLYGKTLGLHLKNRMKIIPVSPSWTDDTDILGYVDIKNMRYNEASIGLVKLLLEAEKNPDDIYLVCFDEMNLAKVEYYFAQFLSILEKDPKDRLLTIYNKALEKDLENSNEYPAEIKIGTNIIFCGTINVDESTFRLSDKVLDRASLICLQQTKFKGSRNDTNKEFTVFDGNIQFLDNSNGLTEDEIKMLELLNDELVNVNPRYGIAYRTLNQINKYMVALPGNNNPANRLRAMDRLIVQKILPKIRGTEDQVGILVGRMNMDNVFEWGRIEKVLKNNDKIEYPLVHQTLTNKVRELRAYGYIG